MHLIYTTTYSLLHSSSTWHTRHQEQTSCNSVMFYNRLCDVFAMRIIPQGLSSV